MRLTISLTVIFWLNAIQDGPFWGCSQMGGKTPPPPPPLLKICHTYQTHIDKYRYRLHFNTYSNYFNFFWDFKGCFHKYGSNFDGFSKIGYSARIKVFWNKGYDVKNFVHDVTNNILSRESNYIVDVIMWPKFGNSSISLREVIITSV